MIDILLSPLAPFAWAITAAGYGLLWTYALWVLYLAVMALKRARDAGSLGPWAHRFGVPVLIVGYALDFTVNVTVCTVLLAELPRETTVTARLKRHKYDAGWRGRVARWVAAHLLDAFDPDGKHI